MSHAVVERSSGAQSKEGRKLGSMSRLASALRSVSVCRLYVSNGCTGGWCVVGDGTALVCHVANANLSDDLEHHLCGSHIQIRRASRLLVRPSLRVHMFGEGQSAHGDSDRPGPIALYLGVG